MSRTVAYLRVSTVDQDLQKFRDEILRFTDSRRLSGPVEWIEEKVSGTIDWRKRALGEVVTSLEAGDALVVPELSRLGRSTLQILEVVKACRERGIRLFAVKGAWTLDDTLESKVLLSVLAMVSEIERELISVRTKEALAEKKRQGIKVGRPRGPGKSKLDARKEDILEDLRRGVAKTKIAKRYGTSAANLYEWLDKRGLGAVSSV